MTTVITILDILIVATLLYWIMLLLKGSRAEKMIWGLGVIVFLYLASERAELLTLHWILNNFLGSIVIVIIVVFQRDIRRALMQMGRPFSMKAPAIRKQHVEELSKAVSTMSSSRVGALIVIEREIDLADFLEAGTEMDARVSSEMLLSIFNASSPLHDGAVVISRDRLKTAGAILPLAREEFSNALGTRHRAAVGISDETDAVVIVVSEKSGDVSIAREGDIVRVEDPVQLGEKLDEIFSSSKVGRLFPDVRGGG